MGSIDPQVRGAPTTSIIALHRRIEELEAERDALREDERLVLSASDNAHETLAEIRGLMPSAWECYSLPFCVVMLIQERDRLRECGRIVGGVSGDALKQLQDALAERDELQNEVARAQDNIVRHMSARSDLMAERDDLAYDVGTLSAERDSLMTRCGLLEAERDALLEVLDTLTGVVGLTPIAGNKEALQEAYDLAAAAIDAAKGGSRER